MSDKLNYNYSGISDEDLAMLYQNGEIEAFAEISDRYRPIIKQLIRPYFLIGATDEDLFQEALISLYKALSTYNQEKNKSFKSYAKTIIKNKIIDTIREYNNNKSLALKYYSPIEGNDDALPFIGEDPEDSVIEKEGRESLIEKINSLSSDKEKEIMKLFFKGLTYPEIAEKLNVNIKTVYNCVARIKYKLSLN